MLNKELLQSNTITSGILSVQGFSSFGGVILDFRDGTQYSVVGLESYKVSNSKVSRIRLLLDEGTEISSRVNIEYSDINRGYLYIVDNSKDARLNYTSSL